MRKRKLLFGITLIFLFTACIIPFDALLNPEDAPADGSIKEEIQQFLDIIEKPTPTPIPQPIDLLTVADEALFAGEIIKARADYQEIFFIKENRLFKITLVDTTDENNINLYNQILGSFAFIK